MSWNIQDIRQKVRLSKIIGAHVALTLRGKQYKGNCPFHKENTPSFVVDDTKGHYHCFGCAAHGDVFDFLMKKEGLSFQEAVKKTAALVGIFLPEQLLPKTSREEASILNLLERACCLFQKALQQYPPALTYLAHRGVTQETIQEFRLGWAPLGDPIGLDDYPSTLLEKAGLSFPGGSFKKVQLRFQKRLLFPIMNSGGKVIAFGGRTLEEKEEPKYLNSPETPVFSKRKTLYGKPSRGKEVVWVEGYFDVLALWNHVPAVASLGTSATKEHLEALWDRGASPVVCFDGDTAGRAASLRLALLALPLLTSEKTLCFMELPTMHDPHSFLQCHGYEGWKRCRQGALPHSHYLWKTLFPKGVHGLIPEEKAEKISKWKDWVSQIKEETLRRCYREFLYESIKSKGKERSTIPASPVGLHEKILLGMVVEYPVLLEQVQEFLSCLVLEENGYWGQLQRHLLSGDGHLPIPPALEALYGSYRFAMRRHFPHAESTLEQLFSHWMEVYNAYHQQQYGKQEVRLLAEALEDVPGVWSRLNTLTQL